MSDIYNLEDALQMIDGIGALVNKSNEANRIKHQIQDSFLNLQQISKTGLYLIWNKPYMVAGRATFIGDMMQKIGIQNVLEQNSRYPELSLEEIKALNPDILFLSSEPYPFKEEHIKELQNQLPKSKVILVDGELFSWYGSRLAKSVAYFNELIKDL
jgi:ABC-type Fe3+-hydroxamate transport system substrate-binding protein